MEDLIASDKRRAPVMTIAGNIVRSTSMPFGVGGLHTEPDVGEAKMYIEDANPMAPTTRESPSDVLRQKTLVLMPHGPPNASESAPEPSLRKTLQQWHPFRHAYKDFNQANI